jgi:uncharacterized protein YjbI with pentapeptide repeats
MARCKDYEICGLEDSADPEAGFCILHSRRADKDPKLFAATLTVHRARNGNNFTRMLFPAPADFAGATFPGPVFFNGATFLAPADFTGVTCKDAAFFQEAVFEGPSDFTWGTFEGAATFSRARFARETTFAGATFSAAANFGRATFSAAAGFPDTTFAGPADFDEAVWAGLTSFARASFVQAALFADAVFGGRAAFARAIFRDVAAFARAAFAGADFTGARFAGPHADFVGCRFLGDACFAGRREEGRAELVFAGAEVDFRGVRVDPAATVTLLEADLSTCRLLDADLARFQILGSLWLRLRDRGDIRAAAFDERAPLPAGEPRPWAKLAGVYREMKRQSLAQGDRERAGEFHCGEREMQRRDPATPRSLRALLALSWALWGHGERFLRPLGWAGVVLGVSTVVYVMGGLVPPDGRPLHPSRLWDWLKAGHHALQVMTLGSPDDLLPIQCAKAVTTLVRLTGPLCGALSLLAIRRRLRW